MGFCRNYLKAGVIAARANNGKFGAGAAAAATEKDFGVVCKIMAIKCDKTVGKVSSGSEKILGGMG